MFFSGLLKSAVLLAAVTAVPMAYGSGIAYIYTEAGSTVGDDGVYRRYDTRYGSTFAPCAACSYTQDGTANVLGLFSSFDQTSASEAGSLPPFPIVNASAYSVADLASGSVRVSGSGNITQSNNGAEGVGQGYGTARLADQLTFHVAGATASTITPITVGYSFDGTSSISHTSEFSGNLSVVSNLSFGGTADFNYTPTNSPPVSTYIAGWASQTYSATPDLFTFQGVFDLSGATYVMPVILMVTYDCRGATCDYSHTGVLNLSLPSNVTYTSDSGVFLTQPLTSAPEPASWAMLLGAVAVAAAVKRLRR